MTHAFDQHETDVWLTMAGTVTRILSDSIGRYDHQRFITACPDGQTVLIVNDVTFGKRVPVQDGETVEVRGQYIWNRQGGLIHFTHHAAYGGQGGWIELGGKTYS